MSTPMPLTLPTATVRGRDDQIAGSRLLNGYTEILGDSGKMPFALYGVPGLVKWSVGDAYAGILRGFIVRSANELIALMGNQLVLFDADGNGTVLGSIAGTGLETMALNQAVPPQIGIVTNAGLYYVLTESTLALNADADLPTPNCVTFLKGRMLFGVAAGQLYSSALDDATSINALSYDNINSNADPLVRVFANSGMAYCFGTQSLEIWQPDPSLAGQPFVYSPVMQEIELGLMGPHAIAKFDRSLIWVDHNGVVRYGRDGGAARISNHTVERAITDLSAADRLDIAISVHAWHGHEVCTIKSAHWTFCVDVAVAKGAGFENAWTERQSYGLDHWRASQSIQFAGKYIMGDETSGILYYLDPDTYTENGAEIVFEVHCPHSHKFPQRIIADAVEIDVVSGVGLNSLTESDADPQMLIDFSDDGAHTWKCERKAAIGRQGEYAQTIRSNRWGRCTKKGRIWRFRASANVLKGISQAYVHARSTR